MTWESIMARGGSICHHCSKIEDRAWPVEPIYCVRRLLVVCGGRLCFVVKFTSVRGVWTIPTSTTYYTTPGFLGLSYNKCRPSVCHSAISCTIASSSIPDERPRIRGNERIWYIFVELIDVCTYLLRLPRKMCARTNNLINLGSMRLRKLLQRRAYVGVVNELASSGLS